MNKYKYLGKNVGLLTVSSFGTKLLSFFLVPLYTNILTTTEYGIYDFFYTTVSLLIPILTINIHDGVLRFTLNNNKENRISIFTSGFRLVVLSSVIVTVFTYICCKLSIVRVIADHPLYFVLVYVSTSLYQLITNYSRGIEEIKEVSIAGIISALTGLTLNIVLLVYVGIGLDGYFIAAISSSLIPAVYLILKLHIFEYVTLKQINTNIKRELYLYSAPLVLNAIGWWVNSASDRYVVIVICGVAANGIYSVGYKIPSILNVFQSIFNQAWVLSSVKEYDPEDSDGFFAKTYNLYNAILVIVCGGIIGCNKFIARFLYLKEFYVAWQYVPYLTIAIIFGALSGHIGGVFSAAKDSKVFSISTLIGAVVNVALNIVLVYLQGPIGAAIATAISYCLVWAIRLISVKKHMTLKINLIRDCFSYAGLVIMTILVQVFRDSFVKYLIVFIVFTLIALLFKQELTMLIVGVKKYCDKNDANAK